MVPGNGLKCQLERAVASTSWPFGEDVRLAVWNFVRAIVKHVDGREVGWYMLIPVLKAPGFSA